MSHTGISENAFHILLGQCGQVAVGHGKSGKDSQNVRHGNTRHHQIGDPDKSDHGPEFGQGGHECGRLVGGPRVHVRAPEMKGKQGQFVKKGNEKHGRADHGDGAVHGYLTGQFGQIGGMGAGQDVREPEQGDGRGRGPEQDVLDGRFGGGFAPLTQGDEGVQTVGGDLQCDEHGHELDSARQEHESPGTQGEHEIVIGPLVRFDAGKFLAVEHGDTEPDGNGQLEELGQPVNPVGIGEKDPLTAQSGKGDDNACQGSPCDPSGFFSFLAEDRNQKQGGDEQELEGLRAEGDDGSEESGVGHRY